MQKTLPVAVQMWFAKGEGWAYHPQFDDKLGEIVAAVGKFLKSSKPQEEFCIQFADGFLIGEKLPDDNCPYEKSANRNPFILRCAFVSEQHADLDVVEAVKKCLRDLKLPASKGAAESLKIAADSVKRALRRQQPVAAQRAGQPVSTEFVGQAVPVDPASGSHDYTTQKQIEWLADRLEKSQRECQDWEARFRAQDENTRQWQESSHRNYKSFDASRNSIRSLFHSSISAMCVCLVGGATMLADVFLPVPQNIQKAAAGVVVVAAMAWLAAAAFGIIGSKNDASGVDRAHRRRG